MEKQMQVLKKGKQAIKILPKLPMLSGKDLEKAGRLYKEHAKQDRPTRGYVDVVSASNHKHVMRVSEKSILRQKIRDLTAIGHAFELVKLGAR